MTRAFAIAIWGAAACSAHQSSARGIDASAPGDGAAGAIDGTSPGDGPGEACQGATVCEDFESTAAGNVPGAPWTISTPNCMGAGTLAVDEAQAHRGAHSLKVAGKGTYCDHVFL